MLRTSLKRPLKAAKSEVKTLVEIFMGRRAEFQPAQIDDQFFALADIF